MGKNDVLFAILGETNSGKDSLVKALIEEYPDKFNCVVSHTNRPMREGETNGVEHYFDSREEFSNILKTKKDDIIAYTKIAKKNGDGYEYLALKEDVYKANIYIIDPEGLKVLKRKLPDRTICAIYIYSSLYTRKKRAQVGRSDYNSEFNKRVEAEKAQFTEFRERFVYDYKIENEYTFEESYEQLRKIVKKYF